MIQLESLGVAEAEEYKISFYYCLIMGPAGFEPTTSSAQGWHPTKLDYDPFVKRNFLANFNLVSINIIRIIIIFRDDNISILCL
jgi:hypothetical protein